jgi:hypothetical protein
MRSNPGLLVSPSQNNTKRPRCQVTSEFDVSFGTKSGVKLDESPLGSGRSSATPMRSNPGLLVPLS